MENLRETESTLGNKIHELSQKNYHIQVDNDQKSLDLNGKNIKIMEWEEYVKFLNDEKSCLKDQIFEIGTANLELEKRCLVGEDTHLKQYGGIESENFNLKDQFWQLEDQLNKKISENYDLVKEKEHIEDNLGVLEYDWFKLKAEFTLETDKINMHYETII
jgi:hypothetical protein